MMGKLIVLEFITLDGFIVERNNKDWMSDDFDTELEEEIGDSLVSITALYLGRLLYEFVSTYLPSALPDLIGEYRLFVHPVVLGNGTSLFKNIKARQNLKLTKARVFRNGVVLLCYRPQ